MKAIKLIPLFIILSSLASGQPDEGRGRGKKDDKIESLKIGFLTQRLNLTPEESQKFWPVFNQFENEMKALRENRKDGPPDVDNMSDKDAEKFVDDELGRRQKELDVMKKYHSQFKQVLPIRKVAKLYGAQEEFKRELLRKLQERKMGGGGMRPGGRRP